MGSLFTNALVLIATLVQAVPAGVCCIPPAPKQVVQAESHQPACCRKKAEAGQAVRPLASRAPSSHCGAPAGQRTPASPSFTCCCSQRVAAPESSVRLTKVQDHSVPSTVVPPVFHPQVEHAGQSPEVRPPGPPVRILLGVWRC